jgi:hypothetical protein
MVARELELRTGAGVSDGFARPQRILAQHGIGVMSTCTLQAHACTRER